MTSLTYRPLGASDMSISPVGVGTAPIGSTPEWAIYWGRQDDTDSIRAIRTAVDAGVNWIDTAPFYGWGRAEEVVGRAVQGRRDDVYIFTKCGTVRDPDGSWGERLTPASIRAEVEASLRRLNVERIDLLQFHDPDPNTPIEESWATLQALIAAGKVRHGGLSNHTPELVERARAVGPVVALQHRYSFLARQIEADMLPLARRRGLGLLAWAPLASGFLVDGFDLDALGADDFRHRHPLGEPERYPRVRRLVEDLAALARPYGRRALDLAIAWVAHQPGVTGAIVGVRNAREARELALAGAWLPEATLLDAVGDLLAEFEV